jgi:hypothetical protein
MKGHSRFTPAEAKEICANLCTLRRVGRDQQKVIRDGLRSSGFYISDWSRPATGFTVFDFEDLARTGRVRIDDGRSRC